MGAAQLKSGKRSRRVRVAGGCWAAPAAGRVRLVSPSPWCPGAGAVELGGRLASRSLGLGLLLVPRAVPCSGLGKRSLVLHVLKRRGRLVFTGCLGCLSLAGSGGHGGCGPPLTALFACF